MNERIVTTKMPDCRKYKSVLIIKDEKEFIVLCTAFIALCIAYIVWCKEPIVLCTAFIVLCTAFFAIVIQRITIVANLSKLMLKIGNKRIFMFWGIIAKSFINYIYVKFNHAAKL